MISTSSVVTRIQTVLTAAAATATVSRVLDFDSVLASEVRTSARLWVTISGEEAAENTLDIGVSQQVSVLFSVIYAAADSGTLDTLRALVRIALLGWVTSDDATAGPGEFRSGEVADLAGDVIWWRDDYAMTYLARAV